MKNSKKLISLLLLCTMLTVTFASCSESSVNNETSAESGSAVVSDASVEESIVEEADADSLDAVVKALPEANYDGYTFTSYNRNWINTTLFMRQSPDEELSGEPINDALWERDRSLEDKYNITLDYVVFEPTQSLYNDAAKIVQSGDASVSLIYGNMRDESPTFLMNKLSVDLNSVPNLELSEPYWSRHNKDIEIAGKLMFATGDITCRYAGAPYLILFNKQMVSDRGYRYPYEDVREGTWTFDKLNTMIDGSYQDLDGNGKVTNADFFGFIFETGKGYAFYNSFGYQAIGMDENNEAVALVTAEDHINAITKIGEFAVNPNNYITTYTYEEVDMFKQNQAIFLDQTACNLSLFTDMEEDFGVLPLPKETEAQPDYYSFCNESCATGVQIPKSCDDLERTGMIVNALAAASRVSSMRAQYEVTLQYRQTRDEDSVEMLRLVSEAARYDYTVVYRWGGLYDTINTSIQTNSPIASKLKAVQKMIPKQASKAIKAVVGDEQ